MKANIHPRGRQARRRSNGTSDVKEGANNVLRGVIHYTVGIILNKNAK